MSHVKNELWKIVDIKRDRGIEILLETKVKCFHPLIKYPIKPEIQRASVYLSRWYRVISKDSIVQKKFASRLALKMLLVDLLKLFHIK